MYFCSPVACLKTRWNSLMWRCDVRLAVRARPSGCRPTTSRQQVVSTAAGVIATHIHSAWATNSPDFAPPLFLVWGFVKDIGYSQRSADDGGLKATIAAAYTQMTRGKNVSLDMNFSWRRSCWRINLPCLLGAFHIMQRFTVSIHTRNALYVPQFIK